MTIETLFRTEDLPVSERFTVWNDFVASTFFPVETRTDHAADFRATVRALDLGAVQLSEVSHPSFEVHRPARLIRRSDPEGYQLLLNVSGNIGVTQGGRDAVLGRTDMVLYDSSRPVNGSMTADGAVAEVVMQFPRVLLPFPENKIAPLLSVPLCGQEGIGALLARSILELTEHADRYTPTVAARLTAVTMDLLAALLAQRLEADTLLPPHVGQGALLARIHAFIEQHLGDPGLTPGTIAAAHQISVRYLHRLFQEQADTVTAHIRHARLEHCHRDLASPQSTSRPILAVAARWGFTDLAHFSRSFRARYGMPPSDFRRLAGHDRRVRG
ncbi:helix-turn-helix domain-containing protein [Streptomyces sp. NBC_01136]|uniref:AraC-like ligand-binding domain-containing protein n=1 Tax=unclassified Streptomyces TaxID=2593676 RepID=UPI00324AB25A|nr:helix-turn-helix domain-containing protein [Streptomyces sp. NBC_01136]